MDLLLGHAPDPSLPSMLDRKYVIVTDGGGKFKADDLPEGDYVIAIDGFRPPMRTRNKPDSRSILWTAEVKAGKETRLSLKKSATTTISGVFKNPPVVMKVEVFSESALSWTTQWWPAGNTLINENGEFTVENVPPGEVLIAPPEGLAEGRIVVDLRLPSWASQSLPYVMDVRDGRLMTCPQDPLLVERYKARPDRDLLCEAAFGTNHLASKCGPCVMEVEKALGTGHVAFGSNTNFGGANQSDVHMDFIFDNVTVALDGRQLIDRGRLCV